MQKTLPTVSGDKVRQGDYITMNRPIALRAAKEALDNIGVQEVGNNAGKAVETYQKACIPPVPPGSPWCAAFVVYRLRNAGHDLALEIPADFPRSAYCPDFGTWARRTKNWLPASEAKADYTKVRIGDLCCFWFAPLNRLAHIGIVTGVFPWGVYTVEGNTSPEAEYEDRVERDGDGVFRKVRAWHELGANGGFVAVDF